MTAVFAAEKKRNFDCIRLRWLLEENFWRRDEQKTKTILKKKTETLILFFTYVFGEGLIKGECLKSGQQLFSQPFYMYIQVRMYVLGNYIVSIIY